MDVQGFKDRKLPTNKWAVPGVDILRYGHSGIKIVIPSNMRPYVPVPEVRFCLPDFRT